MNNQLKITRSLYELACELGVSSELIDIKLNGCSYTNNIDANKRLYLELPRITPKNNIHQ
jgi:hypothetical protein